MQDAARLAAALGETSRLAILTALLEGEATVSDLASRLKLAQPRVSTHLARLRAAGLVTRASIGRHRAYRTDAARVKRLLGALYAAGPRTLRHPSRSADRERRRDTPLRHARTCTTTSLGSRVSISSGGCGSAAGCFTARGKGRPMGSRHPACVHSWGGESMWKPRECRAGDSRPRVSTGPSANRIWAARLGAAILNALVSAGYVRRRPRRRDVRIVKPLARWLAR